MASGAPLTPSSETPPTASLPPSAIPTSSLPSPPPISAEGAAELNLARNERLAHEKRLMKVEAESLHDLREMFQPVLDRMQQLALLEMGRIHEAQLLEQTIDEDRRERERIEHRRLQEERTLRDSRLRKARAKSERMQEACERKRQWKVQEMAQRSELSTQMISASTEAYNKRLQLLEAAGMERELAAERLRIRTERHEAEDRVRAIKREMRHHQRKEGVCQRILRATEAQRSRELFLKKKIERERREAEQLAVFEQQYLAKLAKRDQQSKECSPFHRMKSRWIQWELSETRPARNASKMESISPSWSSAWDVESTLRS
eukprot:NODE_1997_length_1331_cov_27.595944_g1813_i0.p1 GENE.NODE_1997_length_1331_cov_27.595944_g1813_i0~~NODE_1997_length_1331_cov_27.595944_g1813_i0.p1  ORF type:complete len:319 (-),score=63.53 NODE_1997_length_1331_cov_27.595944_g1813_i0:274-1230(-)